MSTGYRAARKHGRASLASVDQHENSGEHNLELHGGAQVSLRQTLDLFPANGRELTPFLQVEKGG